MPIVGGIKFSCQPCVKGHRSAHCNHQDRPLVEIKKKGRPPTQCTACRELRKQGHHTKCSCEARIIEGKASPIVLPGGCAGLPLSLSSCTASSDSSAHSSTSDSPDLPSVELATVGRKKSISRRRDLALASAPHALAHGSSHLVHASSSIAPYPTGIARGGCGGGAALSRTSSTRSTTSEASLSHTSSADSPVVPPTPVHFPTLALPALPPKPLEFPLPALKVEEPPLTVDDLDFANLQTNSYGFGDVSAPGTAATNGELNLDEILSEWREYRTSTDSSLFNGDLTSGSESATSTISQDDDQLDLQFGAELADHGQEWIESLGLDAFNVVAAVDNIARWREELPVHAPATHASAEFESKPHPPPTPYSYSPVPSPPPTPIEFADTNSNGGLFLSDNNVDLGLDDYEQGQQVGGVASPRGGNGVSNGSGLDDFDFTSMPAFESFELPNDFALPDLSNSPRIKREEGNDHVFHVPAFEREENDSSFPSSFKRDEEEEADDEEANAETPGPTSGLDL